MACVIVSDRTTELNLKDSFGRKIDRRNINDEPRRIIMKYMNNDIPSIISHLTASIRNNFSDKRKPQLSSLIFDNPNMSSETDSHRERKIFNSYVETQSYEKFPEILSSSAHEKNYKTKAYSDHFLKQMCDLFSFGRDSFENLTKIQFSAELNFSQHVFDEQLTFDILVHGVLFENIGMSCPNLQHLDLSHGQYVPNSVFIRLVFQDSEASILEQNIDIWTREDQRTEPLCCETDLMVCPDLLYDWLKEKGEVDGKNYAVKMSDLLKCLPRSSDTEGRRAKLNKLCDNLKVLKITAEKCVSDHDVMIPFLLKAFPKLESFDGVENIALAFQQLKDSTNEDAIIEPSLLNRLCYNGIVSSGEDSWENWLETHYNQYYYHFDQDQEIVKILHQCEEKGIGSSKHLGHFVSTVSALCPKASRISFNLPNRQERFMESVWQPLTKLAHLTEIVIIGSDFANVSALLRVVPNLENIRMNFNSKEEEHLVPCVDTVLSQCSKIPIVEWQEQTLKRSTLTIQTSVIEKTDLSSIKRLKVLLNISKEAFFWIWANATRVTSLALENVAKPREMIIDTNLDRAQMFFKSDIRRMFQSNSMRQLEHFSTNMFLSDIETARYFIDIFRQYSNNLLSIDRLHIRVELMQSELVPETIERVAKEMRRFYQYCKELIKETPPTKVDYSFLRIGGVKNYIKLDEPFFSTRS